RRSRWRIGQRLIPRRVPSRCQACGARVASLYSSPTSRLLLSEYSVRSSCFPTSTASVACWPTTAEVVAGNHGSHQITAAQPDAGRRTPQEVLMGYRGQVLTNPVTGERFVFHATSDDTGGKLLEFDLVVEPHGRVPGGHVHPGQQESFEVLDGSVKFRK